MVTVIFHKIESLHRAPRSANFCPQGVSCDARPAEWRRRQSRRVRLPGAKWGRCTRSYHSFRPSPWLPSRQGCPELRLSATLLTLKNYERASKTHKRLSVVFCMYTYTGGRCALTCEATLRTCRSCSSESSLLDLPNHSSASCARSLRLKVPRVY